MPMVQKLEKLLDLARKNGHGLVVYNQQKPDNSFVILGINEYEDLQSDQPGFRGLTQEELVDKINRDIAAWKNEQNGLTEPDFQDIESQVDGLADEGLFLSEQAAAVAASLRSKKPEPKDQSRQSEPEAASFLSAHEAETAAEAGRQSAVKDSDYESLPELNYYQPRNVLAEAEAEAEQTADEPAEKPQADNDRPAEAYSKDFNSISSIINHTGDQEKKWNIPKDRKRQAKDSDDEKYLEEISY